MGTMQPTTQLRWNEDPNNRRHRIEQLWVEMTAKPDVVLSLDYVIPEPKKEWRPVKLVKIGWKSGEFDEPLPFDEP